MFYQQNLYIYSIHNNRKLISQNDNWKSSTDPTGNCNSSILDVVNFILYTEGDDDVINLFNFFNYNFLHHI